MELDTDTLRSSLHDHGLFVLGTLKISESDDLDRTGTMVLIGPDEPAFWGVVTQSPEYTDRQSNPIDRWSRRVLDGLAERFGGTAVYPFGGPPFRPFHTWALRTGRFWTSPIGFLVHDTAGLFASFRGALILDAELPATASDNPCVSCPDQPCATACPVGAFADGYNVTTCKAHVRSPQGELCLTDGCRARRACPVGRDRRLPAQAAFHMKAFL